MPKDIYYDICDGQVFRTDNFFTEHSDALQIIIYCDAVEDCNPLGSQAGKRELDMFYYSLGNFNAKVRSQHCAVRLLAFSNAKLVKKKYGHHAILKPIIDDIKMNAAIASHNNGFTEVADEPGPLKESVFHGNDGCKFKYKAAQARLFLRLLPFILSNLCANNDSCYSLITELIQICQIVFSPVISLPTIC